MPVPVRLRSHFRESTLRAAESADKLVVRRPLFFRNACTAQVIENERRTFTAVAVVDPTSIRQWRCTCTPDLRRDDLCRHIARLVSHLDADGTFVGDGFQASLWRAVATALFQSGAPAPSVEDDARDKLLRGLVTSPQELALLERGAVTQRVAFERSPWFLWSREQFVADSKSEAVTLAREDGHFFLESRAAHEPLRVLLPDAAVEAAIDAGGVAFLRRSGFDVREEALQPAFRAELTPSRELRFIPMLLDWRGKARLRAGLERFGRWFFIDGLFATAARSEPLFAEPGGAGQGSFFEPRSSSGLPWERETVIEEDRVFAFLEKHRDALGTMREDLVPPAIRNARPSRFDDEVLFEFLSATATGLFEIRMALLADGERVSLGEVARARREGIRALNAGRVWVDVTDSQFAWTDSIRVDAAGIALVTRLEYFRIRGSLRGKAVYAGPPELETAFGMFDAVEASAEAPPVADLGMDLYGYQQAGYRWLWSLQRHDFGALLCDDMGLGKTHQAMAAVRALTLRGARSLPVLVVCPTSLVDHWRDKLATYAPSLNVETHRGGGRELRDGFDVLVTSYGVVRSDLERLRRIRFDLVIADEIQAIKNRETATHQALRSIERRVAIGLTGTPIENHTGELAALLDFVVPGYLPAAAEDDTAMLRRLVRPFVLRRTKAQVLTQLPPKFVDKRYCELLPQQSALYRRVLQSRGSALRQQLRDGARVSYVHVLAALNYLKQICNHPLTASGEFREDAPSGKWDAFVELLDESLSSGLKVVVFSHYLPMLRLIEKHLASLGIGYATIKGETRDRGAEVRRFHDDPDCRVFTASLRAAGLGIDLTPASVVIHYDRWWNQAREDQATDRVHRLGQNNGVQVIKLITRGTLEETIERLIERKAALAAEVIHEDDPMSDKQFTPEELDQLLAF